MTGTPQGGIASPILFNIYMHEFDIQINRIVKEMIDNKNIIENRRKNQQSTQYKHLKAATQLKEQLEI